MSKDLTQISDRRRHIVEFVEQYRREHDEGPSMREISKYEDIHPSTVQRHVDQLVDEQYLTKIESVPRSLRVVDQ